MFDVTEARELLLASMIVYKQKSCEKKRILGYSASEHISKAEWYQFLNNSCTLAQNTIELNI